MFARVGGTAGSRLARATRRQAAGCPGKVTAFADTPLVDLTGLIAAIVVGLVAIWLALLVLLYLIRPRDVRATEVIGAIPDVLRLVRDLLADRTTPGPVRGALAILLVWLVNPIDLVPDFIPVLGPLDDVVVTIVILRYVRRRLGAEELRRRWRGSDDGFRVLTSLTGGA